MEKFTIVFSFEVSGGTVPLNATLDITDTNVFSLAAGPAQVMPASNSGTIPPLSYLNVKEKGINLQAAANPSGQPQGLEVAVPVVPSGATLSLRFGYQQVEVLATYQFLGYSRVPLKPGTTVIPFPE